MPKRHRLCKNTHVAQQDILSFTDEARADSDVDLLVEFSGPVDLFDFVCLKQYLEALLGRPVDLGTPDSLKPQLRERVFKEIVLAMPPGDWKL